MASPCSCFVAGGGRASPVLVPGGQCGSRACAGRVGRRSVRQGCAGRQGGRSYRSWHVSVTISVVGGLGSHGRVPALPPARLVTWASHFPSLENGAPNPGIWTKGCGHKPSSLRTVGSLVSPNLAFLPLSKGGPGESAPCRAALPCPVLHQAECPLAPAHAWDLATLA